MTGDAQYASLSQCSTQVMERTAVSDLVCMLCMTVAAVTAANMQQCVPLGVRPLVTRIDCSVKLAFAETLAMEYVSHVPEV
eukprot:15401-Heterococcus_DN1.PRE.1